MVHFTRSGFLYFLTMPHTEIITSYKKLQQLNGAGIEEPGEYRVLIVDDNIFDAELMLRELHNQSKIKFTSKTVTDRPAYEEALKTYDPDIVFCDYSIAFDFTAVEAVKILKEEHPDVPFVLVTGSFTEEIATTCIREGMDDYLLKSNISRLPLALINATNKRRTELEKKKLYEKLVLSEMQMRNFARHINQTLEEERARIAREIHDELGQQLAGIKMGVFSLKNAHEKLPKMASEVLADIDNTIGAMRKIATALRPGILDTLGLGPSIEWLVMEFKKKHPMQCHVRQELRENKFNREISTCFFRVCQEALTNISKHSGANEINVEIERQDLNLVLRVTDNGKGIAAEKLENPFSMGLLGMRERASLAGAHLEITGRKNEGTKVELIAKIS
jgi:signal transduction histidine kinase